MARIQSLKAIPIFLGGGGGGGRPPKYCCVPSAANSLPFEPTRLLFRSRPRVTGEMIVCLYISAEVQR